MEIKNGIFREGAGKGDFSGSRVREWGIGGGA
jgi:hypothetical protein